MKRYIMAYDLTVLSGVARGGGGQWGHSPLYRPLFVEGEW